MSSSAVNESGSHEIVAGLDGDLGSLALRGASWSLGLFLTRHLISVGATAVLSRLLSPGDYGLLGMAVTLTTFLQVFCDMGLSWATVSHKNITRGQMDNLFWANAVVGALLWLLSIAASPGVALFYGHRELIALCMVIGTNFLVGGLAVQPIAVLKRQMRIRELSLLELTSLVVSTVTGLSCAIAGLGYWSLAIQGVAGQLVMAVGAFAISGYRPHMPAQGRGTLALLQFGGWLTAAGIPIFLTRNLDQILIGWRWNPEELGYYNRAYFLMMWPSLLSVAAMNSVMVPLFASIQDDRERLGRAFRKALKMVAFVSFPAALGLAATAPGVVLLIYGPKWAHVIPILTFLSIASAFQPVYNANGWLFIACGKGKALFCWYALAAILFGAAFAVGLPWKGLGVAIGYVVVMVPGATLASCYFAHRAVGLELGKSLKAVAPMLAAAVLMGLIVYALGYLLEQWHIGYIYRLGSKIFAGVVSYVVLTVWVLRCVPDGLPSTILDRLPGGRKTA
jgi:PST family polysaccharide transporter